MKKEAYLHLFGNMMKLENCNEITEFVDDKSHLKLRREYRKVTVKKIFTKGKERILSRIDGSNKSFLIIII